MEMRSTAGTRLASVISNLQSQASVSEKYQLQIASGKKLAKPSDGPSDFVTLVDYKARDLRLDTFLSSINDAETELNEGVSHLTEAHTVLNRAKIIAGEAANAASDAGAYEAYALELDGIINRFIDLTNTKVGNRYLFGGTATTTQPFEITAYDLNGRPSAVGYNGADERSKGIIGQGQTVDTIYAGNRVFQAGPDSFQSLFAIRDALRDPSLTQTQRADALNTAMANVAQVQTQVLNTVGEQSSSLENLEALTSRIEDIQVGVRGHVGELEGADFAEATVRFQEQQVAFQATLAVTAKIFEVSMIDYMR